MNVSVGTGPDSWGVWFPQDDKQVAWSQYLDEVAAAGYEWTELGPYGYLPTDRIWPDYRSLWRALRSGDSQPAKA